MRAMERAVAQLSPAPEAVFVDGPYVPAALDERFGKHAVPLVKGDSRCFSIAAASVIAKVTRDRIMVDLHKEFPQYNFAQHKGYPTLEHKTAVHKHGPCRVHRRTFQPLKSWFPVEAPAEVEKSGEGEAKEQQKQKQKTGKASKKPAAAAVKRVTKKSAEAAPAASAGPASSSDVVPAGKTSQRGGKREAGSAARPPTKKHRV
jgi:hypothetical protein